MTSKEVRELIEREVAGDWSLTNLHGCDLRRCLVPPVQREYDDCGSLAVRWSSRTRSPGCGSCWRSCPEDRSGYKIVYGEEGRHVRAGSLRHRPGRLHRLQRQFP